MANPNIPRVYNLNMERVAFLDKAYNIGYELKLNELWTASFSLPSDDPKNAYCKPFSYVELYDGNTRIDLFRIIGIDHTKSDYGVNTYSCEHVLATLLNDVLFRYHQIGGIDIPTRNVLRYILDAQTTPHWHLGEVDFSYQFEYKWENENLLSALFSVPQCFVDEYRWEWNTEGYPWTLNLKRASEEIKSEIRYKKNMVSVTKTVDTTTMFNRVYPLGYGEGDNQLGIADVNNGVDYLEAPLSVTTYGPVTTILADTTFENAESLKAYAASLLKQSCEPYISFSAEAVDLYRLTGDDFTRFLPGDYVRVIDSDDGVNLTTRIILVSKSDVTGAGGNISITLANKSQDISSSIADLQSRTRISETYAQGSTNLMVQSFSDNADADNPAMIRVYIPAEVVRINKLLLNISFEPFRGYTKAVAGGGETSSSTASGGSYSETTDSGGGTTSTSESISLPSSNVSSVDDGGLGNANHNHAIDRGTYLLYADSKGSTTPAGTVTWVPSGAHTHGEHCHDVYIPSHAHSFRIGSHRHTFTVPSHTHEISFGIYTGTTARSATIKVDGNTIPTVSDYQNIDIAPYLDCDANGKITRNTWHEIAIYPDALTRIAASVFTQLFTNSRGSGDY